MAASLTYRSNATTKPHHQHTASWQDVSLPRHNKQTFERESPLPLSSSLPRKRPRTDGEKVGDGSSKGDYYSKQQQEQTSSNTTHSSSSSKQKIYSIKAGASSSKSSSSSKKERRANNEERRTSVKSSERRASLSSVDSSEEIKAARRSSMESSTTNSSGSGGGGLRRLKKFGSPDKKKKKKASTPFSKPKTPEDKSAAETFQQTQLRLWKAAQERHQKLKEEEEKKRTKKLQKKKLREQLQQERLQKKGSRDLDDEAMERGMDESGEAVQTQKKKKERERAAADASEDREATKARKKLNKLKKMERDSNERTDEGIGSSQTSMDPSISKEEREALKAKKKLKKKLKKMDRDNSSMAWSRNSNDMEQHDASQRSDDSTEDSTSSQDREAIKAKKKLKKLERRDSSAKEHSDDLDVSASSKKGEPQRTAVTSDERNEAKMKKLKRLKKFRRPSDSEEFTMKETSPEDLKTTTTAKSELLSTESSLIESSATTSLETTSGGPIKKKKKKRCSTNMEDEGDMPRKKKNKIKMDNAPENGIAEPQKSTNLDSDVTTFASPERKPTIVSSFDGVPLTPLSLGLADTVKTRRRSPAKVRDELELLQAASFEKKKRKKKKEAKRESLKQESNYAGQPILKKKKKKKKQQLLLADSHLSEGDRVIDFKVERRTDEDFVYDADVEAPPREERMKDMEKSVETMSDIAASEASSSSTVVTGKMENKKKKRRKKFGSGDVLRSNRDDTETSIEGADVRRNEQPLPLKKRMASAAAAAESTAWERHAATSTAASKVSISSAGTAPGATPEFATEASSISEFTHPLGHMALPPPPPASSTTHSFHKPPAVPREILSKQPVPHSASAFSFGVGANASVMGPSISSDESDSDSSCDSDTDEEELFSWANKMFGTSAKPGVEEEQQSAPPTVEELNPNLTPEMCEMERRRQKQEEARTLSIKEVNAILKEEENNTEPAAGHWVRRSMRQPSRSKLSDPLVRKLLDKLRGNDRDVMVLKMKKYVSDPDAPEMVLDAALEALEENSNCEALYIQNFNVGMKDKQVRHLLKILQMPNCNIWCLNIGETYNVTEDTWEEFAEGLKRTKVTHMYASEHTITTELKDEIRETIRLNRPKHNMHNDPNNLDVIIQCTHNWWNPINAKVLRPYLRKRGFESLLNDKESQGLRGSMSEAPAE